MARPREFDLDEALDRAMRLFWLKGYHATTTRDLDAHLGIGHQSLYSAFGDKASLFRSSLHAYISGVLGPMLETLEKPEASKRDVVRFVALMVDFFDTPPPRKGCLITSVATGRMQEDEDVARIVADYTARLEAAFSSALERGVRAGEIARGLDTASAGRALMCTVFGLSVAAHAGVERDALVDMASMSLRPLY